MGIETDRETSRIGVFEHVRQRHERNSYNTKGRPALMMIGADVKLLIHKIETSMISLSESINRYQ
jgi:hypothetical protein